MNTRIAPALLALACLAACGQPASTTEGAPATPQLEAPAPESQPARVFAPANDAARAASGGLTVSMTLRLPDAGSNADAQEVLTLRGENNLALEAQITGAISPATQVEGQTLRALLGIAVEEPQVLVYRVTEETKAANGRGVCVAETPDFVVVWEPAGPGDPTMKVLGVIGGAPGAAGSRPCPMLEYRRS